MSAPLLCGGGEVQARSLLFGLRERREAAMKLRPFALAVLMAGLAAPTAAQQAAMSGQQAVRQEVEAFTARYIDAYNRKDAAGVASLYAEGGVLVPPGPVAMGKENIEKAWRAVFDAGRTGLRYSIQQVGADGNLVWAVGQFSVMSPEQSGVMQERQGNFANVYQREGSDLKFRVHAFNFLPSPPALTGTSTAPTTGTASGSGQ